MICPLCNQIAPTRDNVHVGVHFAKPEDIKPCVGSYKRIENNIASVEVDQRHSQGVSITEVMDAAAADKEKS